VTRDRRPVGLLQVLAEMLDARVVPAVTLDGLRPMVGGPYNVDARSLGALGEATKAGEKICGFYRRIRGGARSVARGRGHDLTPGRMSLIGGYIQW
jgi:hypothetical protein